MGVPFDPSILSRSSPIAMRSALCHGTEITVETVDKNKVFNLQKIRYTNSKWLV